MKTSFCAFMPLVVSVSTTQLAFGAVSATYSDYASWLAAAGGSATLQDFDAYANQTNINGVAFTPGVNVTSNMQNVVVRNTTGDGRVFGYDDTTRATGLAYYDLNMTLPYLAVSFDVDAWNPAAPGPATVEVFFGDLTSRTLNYSQTGPDESSPVFFGIASDTPITKIRWHEGPESSGSGNEEVALDNIAVSRVPEPALMSLGLTVLFALGRRGGR
jgi:hypothetical protein